MKRIRAVLRAQGPGATIGIIAIVLALTGAAFAASGKLTAPQKKEVKAIVKAEVKKVKGTPGAQGPKGDTGLKGDTGPEGKEGKEGKEGEEGAAGESPVGTPFEGSSEPTGNPCNGSGGVEYEVPGSGEPSIYVCNGEEGSPWTAGNVLPPPSTPGCVDLAASPPREGCTETGAWTMTGTTANTNGVRVPISFSIPLGAALAPTNVHWQEEANFADFDEGGPETIGCTGTAAAPAAPSGHLCVYLNGAETPLANVSFEGIFKLGGVGNGANRAGASLQFTAPTGEAVARGAFAVAG